ncbi:MAG: hypothetical protein HY096_02375 [Nitrospinae bacterium]|nr:hypothetical protein [Nitrospinota bacterium]
MKRHFTDEKQFILLRMLDDFARSKGLSINNEKTFYKFMEHLSKTVKKHRDKPTLVHGFRIESMFAHMAASMGECNIITEEDSGSFFSLNDNIRRPDFRVLTRGGEQYFIEVKNFHKEDPLEPYKIKKDYLSTLKEYAEQFDTPLKVAIYWSRWKLWALVDSRYFNKDNSDFNITLFDAMKRNEMALLGDRMIGTFPPLSFRIYADSQKPRTVDENCQVHFTIGNAVICAGGKEITDELEKKLAWVFMLYGGWDKVNQPAKTVNGFLDYTEFSVEPEEWDRNQGFAILDFLSKMISSHYNYLTSPEGKIRQLVPNQQYEDITKKEAIT